MTPDLLKAAILGLVEGATEFIPVSSTGHLIVAGDWLGFTGDRAKTFEVFIQLGAILAILWIYRTTFLSLATGWWANTKERRLLVNLVVAFLPAAIVGLLAHHWIKAHLFGTVTVAGALIVGGIAILLIERMVAEGTIEPATDIPVRIALGCRSGPGPVPLSRRVPFRGDHHGRVRARNSPGGPPPSSPSSWRCRSWWPRPCSTLWDSRALLSRADVPVFAIGFGVAFLSALVVVKAFLAYVSRHNFAAFAWYRIGFGILVLLLR